MAKRNKRERAEARRAMMHGMEAQLAHAHFRLQRLAAAGQREAVRYFEAHLSVNDAPATPEQVVAWAQDELESPEGIQALMFFEPDEFLDFARTRDIAARGERLGEAAPTEEPPHGS